jgi:hypothetical protein
MKQAIQMGSSAITYISSLKKIGSGTQMFTVGIFTET